MRGVNKNAIFSEIFNKHSCFIHKTLAYRIVADTIGEKIRNLRYKLNLTQLELAKFIHRGFGTVSKWEEEIRIPSYDDIEEIIRVYGVDKDYFKL